MAKGDLSKEIATKGVATVVVTGLQWLVTTGAPIWVPIVGGAVGFFTSVPIFFILVGMSILAAMTAFGLFYFSQWSQQRSPENKLGVAEAALVFEYDRDATGQVVRAKGAQVFIKFTSIASFPMSFVLDDLNWSVDGRVAKDRYKTKSGEIVPFGGVGLALPVVELDGLKPRIEARVKLKLRYGRKGNERIPIERNFTLAAGLDPLLKLYVVQTPPVEVIED